MFQVNKATRGTSTQLKALFSEWQETKMPDYMKNKELRAIFDRRITHGENSQGWKIVRGLGCRLFAGQSRRMSMQSRELILWQGSCE